jgi:hypothetical protein
LLPKQQAVPGQGVRPPLIRPVGVSADPHHDPLGPAVVSFRDPDHIQLEFFEQV